MSIILTPYGVKKLKQHINKPHENRIKVEDLFTKKEIEYVISNSSNKFSLKMKIYWLLTRYPQRLLLLILTIILGISLIVVGSISSVKMIQVKKIVKLECREGIFDPSTGKCISSSDSDTQLILKIIYNTGKILGIILILVPVAINLNEIELILLPLIYFLGLSFANNIFSNELLVNNNNSTISSLPEPHTTYKIVTHLTTKNVSLALVSTVIGLVLLFWSYRILKSTFKFFSEFESGNNFKVYDMVPVMSFSTSE